MKADAFVVDKVKNGYVVQVVFNDPNSGQPNRTTYVFTDFKEAVKALKELSE